MNCKPPLLLSLLLALSAQSFAAPVFEETFDAAERWKNLAAPACRIEAEGGAS